MRDTASSNMNSDLNPSAYGTFMNTPLTPVYPNQTPSSPAKVKKSPKKEKEDPAYKLESVQSDFSL